MTIKHKNWTKTAAVILLIVAVFLIANPKPTGVTWLDGTLTKLKINMGLDLQGGVHLVYEADMSEVEKGKEAEALSGIQDVIERRVNAFGVAEPKIHTSSIAGSHRLVVELAGIKDVEEAKNLIKETPFLEFKEQGEPKTELSQEEQTLIDEQVATFSVQAGEEKKRADETLQKALAGEDFVQLAKENSADGSAENGGDLDFFKKGVMVPEFEEVVFRDDFEVGQIYPELVKSQFGYHIIKKTDQRGEGEDKEVRASHILLQVPDEKMIREQLAQQLLQPEWIVTGLSGKQLERSQVDFDQQTTGEPMVLLQFNDEGTKLFKEITERNVGQPVAIFLDGQIISAPVVQDVIRNGEAVISGNFNLVEAKELSKRLNAGALPVPITLISQQSVEASLGKISLEKSLQAGLWGLILVAIFMILYYRLAGVVAMIALAIYIALMVSIFKLSSLSQTFTITLTLSGIAGFILSIGMAVDANILIFERMKEEIKRGRDLKTALDEGFKRAWTSIRDGNLSTILTALILMTFGTGFVKGFAIILVIGVLLSMFTAIVVTRMLLRGLFGSWSEKRKGLVLVSDKGYNKTEE